MYDFTFLNKPKKVKFGIKFLDNLVPYGFPINSFILISGETGISKTLLLHNIMLSFIKRRYHCIYICTDEHPLSICQNIKNNFRVKNKIFFSKIIFLNLFNAKFHGQFFNNYIKVVNLYSNKDTFELLNLLINIVDNALKEEKKQIIIFDSITEIFSKYDPNLVLELIKNIIYEICKKRSIPLFASFHFGIKSFEDFEQIIEGYCDGVFDLRYDPSFMQKGILIKQIRIRKLKGTFHDTAWHSFTYRNGKIIEYNLKFETESDEIKYQNLKNI